MKKLFTILVIIGIFTPFVSIKADDSTKQTEWEYIGIGYFRDCLLSAFYHEISQQDIPVPVYRGEDDYGTVYRLENIYANWNNDREDIKYDASNPHDMFIHIFSHDDKDYIWIEDFDTGIRIQDLGKMTMYTQVGGRTKEDPASVITNLLTYPGCYGNIEDGLMTYPITFKYPNEDGTTTDYNNILIGFTYAMQFFSGNTKDCRFAVSLPGVDLPEIADPFDDYELIGTGLFYENFLAPFLQTEPSSPYAVEIYKEKDNPYYFHIKNPWGDNDILTDLNYEMEIYFPFIEEENSYYLNAGGMPWQYVGFEKDKYGEVSMVGIAYYNVTYGRMTWEAMYENMPEFCIYLDIEKNKIVFPENSVVYSYDTLGSQFTFPNDDYIFEGYLEFPQGYFSEGENSAVNEIIMTDTDEIRYYNLQGIEIKNPRKGQIVIQKQGNKSRKSIIKP